jgi:hypothetical protein
MRAPHSGAILRSVSPRSEKNMEHRWGERISAAVEVRLIAESSRLNSGVLRDVSISGGFIETEWAVPLWARLHIEIVWLPGSVRERIAACVARVDERGIGVEWQELAPGAVVQMMASRLRPWQAPELQFARSA